MLCNFVLVPKLIKKFASMEPHESNSSVNRNVVIKVYIFLTFIYILLPLAGFVAVSEFFSQMKENADDRSFFEKITENMGSLIDYYLQ